MFKEGEVWNGERLEPPNSGTSGNPITFGSYGDGAKPIINVRGDIPGWGTGGNWTNEGGEKLTDGGMEDWIDANDLTSWAETTAGSSTVNQDEDEHGGTYACRFDVDAGGNNALIQQDFTLAALTTYTTSIWHKETGSAKIFHDIRCQVAGDYFELLLKTTGGEPYSVWDAGNGNFLPNHADNYTEYTHTFTTPDAAGTYTFYIQKHWDDDESQSMYQDDVSVNQASNLWYISLAIDPLRVFIDGTEYVEAENKAGIDSTYRWWYDSGNTNLYVYATENPASAYSDIDGSHVDATSNRAVWLAFDDYITLENLDLRGGEYTLVISASNYTVVDGCDVGKHAGTWGVVAWGNDESPYEHSTYGEIKNCTIESDFDNSGTDYHSAVGNGITLINGVSYFKVHDCTVSNWNHNCIDISCSDSDQTTHHNEIYDNDLSSPNTSYCRGVSFDTDFDTDGTCAYNEVYRNYIHDTSVQVQIHGNHNKFYYNIIDTVTDNGYGEADLLSGIALFASAGQKCHDNEIYNNVIYGVDYHGIAMWGAGGGYGDKENNLIKNNIIMNWGSGEYGIHFYDDSSVKGNTWENNCLYKSGVSDVVYNGHEDGDDYERTVAEFNGDTGEGGDTIANNISSDPKFIDAASDDFRLLMASPCVDAGTDVSLLIDYLGLLIRHVPDMGAYEEQANALFW